MLRFLAGLFLVLFLTRLQAQENITPNTNVDYRLVALRVAEEFAEPRYGALLTRAEAQDEAWKNFCKGPSDEGFERLTGQFANTVNAWANIELVRYGPISDGFRYERIAYWPERKNDVARGVLRMLSETDVLTPQAMPAKSVAVQGLSALERLLYDEGARNALFAGGDDAKRRCAAGVAIAGNVRNVVKEILDAWPELKEKLRATDPTLAREAVTRFATDLLTIYQVTGDQKLDAVMGKTLDEARPKAAQWWRSGLSAQTLAFNLKSAADLIWILLGPGPERDALMVAHGKAETAARDMAAPLPDMAVEKKQRRQILLLRDMLRSARDLAGLYIPPALGITLGFNSLDGD